VAPPPTPGDQDTHLVSHTISIFSSRKPVAWENILDLWYNYVKGHNPKDYFGIYDSSACAVARPMPLPAPLMTAIFAGVSALSG
jgi:hypothetical protein